MGVLDRSAILGAQDVKTETVDVPEWGGQVIVAMMSAADRDAWEQSLVPKVSGAPVDVSNIRARLCVRCLVDEKGKRIFKDEDAEALGKKSAAAVTRVAKVIQRLNAMDEQAVEDAKGN